QHVVYWDKDQDGIIWPLDTYRGCRAWGWNPILCLIATFLINVNLSYPTSPSWIPDPFFRIHISNLHKDKHGSDSMAFDNEGRFKPQNFEDLFSKYDRGNKGGLDAYDLIRMHKGQRMAMDFFGWSAAFFEWLATYLLLWPEDGVLRKDDVRRIYDGSIFQFKADEYAVIAAVLYLICSMLLMVNMLGYFLGHYPQRFNLTNSQRTLILQTMLFFVWLAGGAGVFSLVESKYGEDLFNWSYVNALYFCQVTVLTIGFGDLYASSNIGRGLIMPYAVGGIIMLGLIVTSLTTFAAELGEDNIVQKHIERSRTRTIGRSYTSSIELRDHEQQDCRPMEVLESGVYRGR
ncbi:Caleosin-domain-containing protein, partial [Aureobasidium pullulans]